MKKRVLIDGTTLVEQIDGLTRYALNVISRLDVSQLDITLLATPKNQAWLEQQLPYPTQVADIAPIGPKRDYAFCQWLKKNQHNYDIFFEPSNQYPRGVQIPSLFVDHDVIYEEFPEQLGRLGKLKRLYLHHVVHRGLKQARKTICVSQYTKDDTMRYHGRKYEQKMVVIGEGWEHLEGTIQGDTSNCGKYLFYLGSSRGHKNVRNLLRAVQLIQDEMKKQGYRLIITGRDDNYQPEDRRLVQELGDVVEVSGWITDQEMEDYFRGAEALVFPSLSEGFGIPLLEAFYYHVPVVCSRKASLPEVAEEAALYFDPLKVEDIAQCLKDVITGQYDRAGLIEKGQQRLQIYSWQKAACQITNELLSI